LGAVPSVASAAGVSGEVYNIADYYNEDGGFSDLALELEGDGDVRILPVVEGDIVIVGDRQFVVLVESYEFAFYTQSSLEAAIEWWTDYLLSLEESGVVAEINKPDPIFVGAEASAFVVKLGGNTNELYITVTEYCEDGSVIEFEAMFVIRNNAEGTYSVDGYSVYVDTKGNDQVRACYIVE